jgi:hypothetical protein
MKLASTPKPARDLSPDALSFFVSTTVFRSTMHIERPLQ